MSVPDGRRAGCAHPRWKRPALPLSPARDSGRTRSVARRPHHPTIRDCSRSRSARCTTRGSRSPWLSAAGTSFEVPRPSDRNGPRQCRPHRHARDRDQCSGRAGTSRDGWGTTRRVLSAIKMNAGRGERCIRRRAIRHLEKGRIVILRRRQRQPVLHDRHAAARAIECGGEVMLKGRRSTGSTLPIPMTVRRRPPAVPDLQGRPRTG